MHWILNMLAALLRRFRRAPLELGSGLPTSLPALAAALPEDLQAAVGSLKSHEGVVVDTVEQALLDYQHLHKVMMGPGASANAIDDVSLIAHGQTILRELLLRAPDVAVLVDVARERAKDREGRSAAGDAILLLRDQGKQLHQFTSASLQWAASRKESDLQRLQEYAHDPVS